MPRCFLIYLLVDSPAVCGRILATVVLVSALTIQRVSRHRSRACLGRGLGDKANLEIGALGGKIILERQD